MSNEDLSAVDFSRLLSKLPERLPISDAYDARRPGSIDSLSTLVFEPETVDGQLV